MCQPVEFQRLELETQVLTISKRMYERKRLTSALRSRRGMIPFCIWRLFIEPDFLWHQTDDFCNTVKFVFLGYKDG